MENLVLSILNLVVFLINYGAIMIVTLLFLLSISFPANWNNISSPDPSEPIFSLEGVSGSTTTIKLSLDGYYSKNINLDGNTFIKLTIDWNNIFKIGKYTGMIIPEDMSQEEIKIFLSERKIISGKKCFHLSSYTPQSIKRS